MSVPSGRTEIVLTRLGSAPTGETGVAFGAAAATIGVSVEGATGEASAEALAAGGGALVAGVAALSAGEADGCGRAERSTGASGGSTSLGGVGVGCAVSRVSSEPDSLAVRIVYWFGGATLVGAVEARISGGAPE